MKLNLLPATVGKGAKARTAWIGSVLLILAGVGASAFMIITSGSELREMKEKVREAGPRAAKAFQTSQDADAYIAQATPFIRNTNLAKAMIAHNDKYPKLYNDLRNWVPSFFRITSISATPINETTSQVTMQGTLETYQQYADLMLALLRFREVQSVGRTNYVATEKIVPSLTPVDQVGRPRTPNEAPIPDDPLERLAYFQSQATTEQFSGVGNFGTATEDTRLAMPNSSLVTVTLVISRDLRVPDARGTLSQNSGPTPGGGATGGGMPTAPFGGPPPGPSGPGAGSPAGSGAANPESGDM